MTFLSPAAKAYVGALITFLTALVAADDLDARAILTALLAALVGGGGVYAVPNSAPAGTGRRRRDVLDVELPPPPDPEPPSGAIFGDR